MGDVPNRKYFFDGLSRLARSSLSNLDEITNALYGWRARNRLKRRSVSPSPYHRNTSK